MVTLLLSLGAPALASAAAGSGAPKPGPQKAVSAGSPPTPAPDPAPQAQTLTSSPHAPVSTSQPVGGGLAVSPVSAPSMPVTPVSTPSTPVTPASAPSTPVTHPSPSTGSAVRVPHLSATNPSTHSVARAVKKTSPATHDHAALRASDRSRGTVTHRAARSHAPSALTLLAHQDLPRLPSHAPFAGGPVGSSGGMSAVDAATLALAAIVMLSPFAPLLRRALAKTSAHGAGRHN
jgi:hypothetical protein